METIVFMLKPSHAKSVLEFDALVAELSIHIPHMEFHLQVASMVQFLGEDWDDWL